MDITNYAKEQIRVEVQNALCELTNIHQIIDDLELGPKDAKWAKENLDFKVVIL